MPWAQIHPFFGWFIIHYCFRGNLHSSAVFWTILWGSIFPDLPRHLFLLWHIFVCDNIYLTDWGCNKQFISNAENWTHSFPITIITLIISYIIYCFVSNKTMMESLGFKKKIIPFSKQTMHPNTSTNPAKKNKLRKIDEEKTNLLNINNENNNNPEIEIISVTTYSSITSLRYMDHRHNSFDYRYGSSLNCKNCWIDSQSFWRLFTYFFYQFSFILLLIFSFIIAMHINNYCQYLNIFGIHH